MGMSLDANGWTVITPTAPFAEGNSSPPAGTMKIFVAPSPTGNDANDGSSAHPVATPSQAVTMVRDNKPDWILLQKGGVWTDNTFGNFIKSGLSATEPIVFSSYDPNNPSDIPDPYTGGARPQLQISTAVPAGAGLGLAGTSNPINNIAVLGIDFYAYKRDPASGPLEPNSTISGVYSVANANNNILIEDCKFSYGQINISLSPQLPVKANSSNFTIRRNVIMYAYSVGGGTPSDGIILDPAPGTLIEENLLDHNGWSGTVAGAGPSGFKHNIYGGGANLDGQTSTINAPMTFRGNILANEGQGSFCRAGGQVTNNLFVQNATSWAIQSPNAGFQTVISDNVITEGVLTNEGLTMASDASGIDSGNTGSGPTNGDPAYLNAPINLGTALIANNIIANSNSTGGSGFSILNGQNGHIVTGNYLYNWNSSSPSAAMINVVGGIYSVSINNPGTTPYTDLSTAITASAASTDGNNNIVVTVASATGIHARSWVYITSTQVTGLFLGNLNGTQIQLYDSTFTVPLTGSPTLYFPYYQTALNYPVSGSGSLATADIISAGGNIVAVVLYGSDTSSIQTDDPGKDYIAGNTLTATIPGGSGFQCTVTAICQNTTSPNKLDPTGTNSFNWPDPTRTVARYNNEKLGGPNTVADFLSRARGQSKSSWNLALTADAVNDWIQEGFGIFETTAVSPPGLGFSHWPHMHKHQVIVD